MDTTTAAAKTPEPASPFSSPSVPANARHPGGAPHRDWHRAGDAWGRRANDWACLYEHYSSEVLAATHHRIGTGPGVRLLDIACGAGGVIRYVESLGARAAGID